MGDLVLGSSSRPRPPTPPPVHPTFIFLTITKTAWSFFTSITSTAGCFYTSNGVGIGCAEIPTVNTATSRPMILPFSRSSGKTRLGLGSCRYRMLLAYQKTGRQPHGRDKERLQLAFFVISSHAVGVGVVSGQPWNWLGTTVRSIASQAHTGSSCRRTPNSTRVPPQEHHHHLDAHPPRPPTSTPISCLEIYRSKPSDGVSARHLPFHLSRPHILSNSAGGLGVFYHDASNSD